MVVITILAVIIYAIATVEFMQHIEFRRVVTMPNIDATLLAIFGFCRVEMRPSSATGMKFVFSVCRLVSRRCHNISAIHQLCLTPSQNRTSSFPTSGSSFNLSALQKGSDLLEFAPGASLHA
jgi:hypothetical protein